MMSSLKLLEWSRTVQAESTCKKRIVKYSIDNSGFSLYAMPLLIQWTDLPSRMMQSEE